MMEYTRDYGMDYQRIGAGIPVTRIMSRNVRFVSEDESISAVMKFFDEWRISGAPVVSRDGEAIGVITKTDLVDQHMLERIRAGQDLNRLKVRDILKSRHIWTVDETVSVEEAASLMLRSRIHRVFVKDRQGKIQGVVSTFDIMKIFASETMTLIPQIELQPES